MCEVRYSDSVESAMVQKIIDVAGRSPTSFAKAAENAVATAAETVRNLKWARVAEVRDGIGGQESQDVPSHAADLLRRRAMRRASQRLVVLDRDLIRDGRADAGRSRKGPRSFPRSHRRVARGRPSPPRSKRPPQSCLREARTAFGRLWRQGQSSESRRSARA